MSMRSRRLLPVVGVGALVLLNVVLVVLLVTRPGAPDVDARDTPAVREETSPPSKRETQELDLQADGALVRGGRLLVNVDATTAWRADVGSCGSPGTLEHSADGGRTWQELPVDLAPVSRVRALGPESLVVIGGGAGCEPTYLSSATSGTSWTTNDQYLDGSWYLAPDDPDSVATPVGSVGTPCEAVQLAARDAAGAAVLCADATVALTADGGASWSELTPDIRARAIGVADEGYVVAGVWGPCADALAVSRLTSDGSAAGVPACTAVPVGEADEIAVSAGGGWTWVWSGDEVAVAQ